MKKFAKLASAAATVVMAASVYAQSVPYEQKAVNDNVGNGTSEWVWKNGTSELCWRDSSWTPATANIQCDGALAPARTAHAATPVAKHRPRVASAVASEKVTFAADTLFDFDKVVLKPEGKAKLDDLVSKLQGVSLEAVITVGHTDSFGSDKYNDRLSVRRAEAVKGYLVNRGIQPKHIYTEGKGKRQLKINPTSCTGPRKEQLACQQPNRRVDIEVVGMRRAR